MPLKTRRLSCDVLVAGGGAAGMPCALAAARSGAKVVLCQDRPVLGGNASSEVRMHIVGANATGSLDRGRELETEAREGGIIEELRLENCVHNPQRSASVFDLILYDKCRAESNLNLLLNTTVVAAEREGDRILSAIAERQSTEERFQIDAKVFVDCTGDGRLGLEAGAAFMTGRESVETFGESLAVAQGDDHRLGSTILLQARKHDRPMPFTPPSWARRFTRSDLRLRLYANPGEECPTHEYGYWWAEWGGTLDTVGDNEQIRDELLSIALGIWDHVKNGPADEAAKRAPAQSDPLQASHWALDWIGFLPGKRESRRFIGQHVLTEQDVLESRPFPDAIAYGGWSLDLHPPEGIDAPDVEPCEQHAVPHLYDIPLRCCVARDIANLMFAGRNLSASHVAFSSTRVMATCAVVGQGVGTAAAYAAHSGASPGQLANDPEKVQRIQQQLLRDDCFLIGIANQDEWDLARQATIRGSSETPQGAGSLVTSGSTRAVHGPRGVSQGRCVASSHRWMSDPSQGLPAWLELQWEGPVEIGEIRMVFDTGLHRHLTLSHHDGYTARMAWGRPQPETARDYELATIGPGDEDWTVVTEVQSNCQRLRVHSFPEPLLASKLRVTILTTNGIDRARIVELRVYPPSCI